MKKIWKFFLLSILIHLLLLFIAIPEAQHSKAKRKHIVVSLLGKSPTKTETKPQEIKKPEKKEEEPEELEGQVVDLPPDHDAERPEDADFLSETDHSTERETVSRHRSLDGEQAGHEKTKANDVEDTTAETLGSDADNQEEQRKRELPKVDQRESLVLDTASDGTLKNDKGSDELAGKGESLHLGEHDEDAESSNAGAKEIQLFPDQRTLAKIASAPFSDAVEDVDEGEGTFLNTWAFKYAGFYNRVKRNIANVWRPLNELRRRDPTGNIYGKASRRTVLTVILDSDGQILSLKVKKPCGVDFLDTEATSAFWRAKGFPNPPSGMIKDGKVTFEFGFEVSFHGRTLF